MKQNIFFGLLVFLILSTALPINAQQCGDVSGDGAVNIVDMVRLIDWVIGSGPTPPIPQQGDMDNREGVTQGDISRLAWYLFGYSETGPLDCSPAENYSFTPSPEDTLFVPRYLNVPADQDVVHLPILTNLRDDSRAVTIYLQKSGPGFDDIFDITWLEPNTEGHNAFANVTGDTLYAGMMRMNEGHTVSGLQQVAMITFSRKNPGEGNIELIPTDRSSLWRIGVVKDDYDIRIPTIVTVDYNDNVLQAAPTEMQFESVFGFPAPEVVQNISLSDISAPINCSAAVNQDWLNIDVNYGTTPSTIQVSVDPAGLSTGVYNGTVSITDMDSPHAMPIEVPVTLIVRAPFPSMDANCDGKFNISDLTYIVAYLFGNPHGPAPCDPSTGTFPQQ